MFRGIAPSVGPHQAPATEPPLQPGLEIEALSSRPTLLPTPDTTPTDSGDRSSGNSNTRMGAAPAVEAHTRTVLHSRNGQRRGGASSAQAFQPRHSCQMIRPLVMAPVVKDLDGTTRSAKFDPKSAIGRGRIRQIKVQELEQEMASGGVTRKDKRLGDASYLTEMLSEKQRRSVVLPNSRFKNLWDLLIAILVSYTAIMLPIQLCFDCVPQSLPKNLVLFDVFTDIVFITDIFLNFNVGFIEDAVVVVDKRLIRQQYFKRWFGIDVVGSFPGDSIFLIIELVQQVSIEDDGCGSQEASLLTLFKILKVPKLLRLGRLFKSLEKLEGAANIANIIILLAIMVVVNHWIACLWFLTTKGSSGWVASRQLEGLQWTEQYPETFYTTLMMVMGDSIDPSTGGEYILASLVVVVGITMNATVFASIATYAAQISAATATHKNKMNSIQRSIKSLKLPDGLAARIQQYYEYCWGRHRDFSAQNLLDDLPSVFQRRCAMNTHEEKLRRFGPFSQADDRFIASLTTKLQPEVYMPEAYILVSGQVYSCAYFCARGLCQVTWPAETRDMVNALTVDDYFGELSLFVSKKLSYTVRAITHVDCYRLERTDFISVMKTHPAGAVHVADHMDSILPSSLAKKVTREIYDYSGLRELLKVFMPDGKWRPPKGLSERLRRFAVSHAEQLQRIRDREGRSNKKPVSSSDVIASRERRASSQAESRKSDTGASFGANSAAGLGSLRRDLSTLTSAHKDLAERVESGQARLEAKLEQLATLLGGGAGRAPVAVLNDVLGNASSDDLTKLSEMSPPKP